MNRSTTVNVNLDLIFSRLLHQQRNVQIGYMGGDPADMDDATKIQFVKDMTLAAVAELMETLDESQWKPWAKFVEGQPVIDRARFKGELADVFIFLMNLMLAADLTSSELLRAIDEKQRINIQRQLDGYTGKDKCPGCKRAYDDPAVTCRKAPPYPNDQPLRIVGWCAQKDAYISADGKATE